MLDEETDASTRRELLRLTPSGDLLDLAREMRDMGVESLLFCAPSGRIEQVVTDRQIAHLAATPEPVAVAGDQPPAAVREDVEAAPSVPRQEAPLRDDRVVPVSRS